MSRQDDATLLQRARHGDHASLGRLVERYRGPVFGLCLDALGSVEDAQDATQDTFLRACLHLEQLREPAAFPAWLAAVARRECSGRLRKGRAAPERLADEPVTLPDLTERLERQRLVSSLRAQLASLPTDTRLIYLLSCLDGLTSTRIGAFLGMQPGAVRARLHRARRRLAEALTEAELTEGQRTALSRSVPEVIAVSIWIASAQGPWPEAAFPDDVARALYSYLYTGVAWRDAVARVGLPEPIAASYRRTWERYRVVSTQDDDTRPLMPLELRSDRPLLRGWRECLVRGWVKAAQAQASHIADLVAAAGGWEASAREAVCLWFPLVMMHGELSARGLYLPPTERPSGACHLFGGEHGWTEEAGDEAGWGLSDPETGDGDIMMKAVIWYHCRHSPEVGKFLDRGSPLNPLPRILVTFREDPPRRPEALARLGEATERYAKEGRQPTSADDLLDRLIGWRVLSADEPHGLLLPVFTGDVAVAARDLAAGIARGVAREAEESRGTLEEMILQSSFAQCNRADVHHLVNVGLLFPALKGLIDVGLVPPFPDACFADRGPFIYDHRTMHG